jgi:hypothetical protein
MNIKSVPVEILYQIMDWLDPFDIINFCHVFSLKPSKRYYLSIHDKIYDFCDGNNTFSNIVNRIISDKGFVDYDIFNILGDILHIIKRSSKYMDILGFNTYVFNLKRGPRYISKYTFPIIYIDTQIINIHYPNINILQEYLETYMNFNSDEKNKHSYKIRKYNMRFLVKN